MIGYYDAVILGYSIAIAAVTGLVRFRNIAVPYRPFIYIMVLGLCNHTLSVILNETVRNNAVNSNIYVLAEVMLYTWLFRNWQLFSGRLKIYYALLVFLPLVWIYDNLLTHRIDVVNSLSRIIFSFVLIFLSIEQLNREIVKSRKNVLKNSIFLICCGILIYFSYKATIEVFYFIKLKASIRFYVNIFIILVFVNALVNLIFAWAVIWIPKRLKYTSPH